MFSVSYNQSTTNHIAYIYKVALYSPCSEVTKQFVRTHHETLSGYAAKISMVPIKRSSFGFNMGATDNCGESNFVQST